MIKAVKAIKNNKATLLVFVLVLFYLSEAFTTIALKLLRADFYNYSALIKACFALFAIGYALRFLTVFRKSMLLFLIFAFLAFFLGQYSFQDYAINETFFQNLIYFSRYVLVFIIALIFFEDQKMFHHKLAFTVYEKIVVFNSILVLIGVFFDINLFQTYYNRFGYNGLFMTPSISTFFYALALTYFLNIYLTTKEKLPELLLVSLICFLTGARALTLFFILSLIHIGWVKKWYLKKLFYLGSTALVVVVLLFRKNIYAFLQKSYAANFELYQQDGLITALTSFRNLKLQENFLPLIAEKWHSLNYLFGGTDFVKYRVEFEIFDIFLFFGIIGSIVYLFFYFKHIIRFRILTRFGSIQMVLLLCIAMLSGTFFNNAPVALYLLVVLSSLYIQSNSSRNEV